MQGLTTADPVLLMCPPEFYSISGPDEHGRYPNKFAEHNHKEYSKDPAGFLKRAKLQWNTYQDRIHSLGVKTLELDPVENIGDMVFTADPTLSIVSHSKGGKNEKRITITSHFSHTERQNEVEQNTQFIKMFDPKREILASRYKSEGTGDNYYDPFRDVFWSGYTENPCRENASAGRTDIRAHQGLRDLTGIHVHSMNVREPFFHIDTCMAPLSRGHIIAYKEGMTEKAFERLIQEGFLAYGMDPDEFLILVDDKDAKDYACNLRCLGDHIIMPKVSIDLQERLSAKGYDVHALDISAFISDGGAMHCLTNNINEQRIVGGHCQKHGYAYGDHQNA
tara:strand:- start:1184 stop:2191 length:1008 start_codon:yes stop_codon:yes gene_type:complete